MPDNRHNPTDRRTHARASAQHPVKVRCEQTGRYYHGQSENLSSGGALVRLEAPARFTPGRRVRMGLALGAGQVLLESHGLAPATVVRSLVMDGRNYVAVRYDNAVSPQAMPAAA